MLAAPVQQSFAVGEIGPALWGRTDLQWHASAAKELENFIATPHGPVRCRGGARFIAEVDDSADLHRLLPFRPSVTDAYMLIFGDQTIRFGREKGIIESGGSPLTLASGDGVVWPSTALARLRAAQSLDVLFLFCTGYKPKQLSRTSHTSWTLADYDFQDGPYYPENTTATTMVASAGTGAGVTITASSTTGINNNTGFQSTDVGRLIRMRHQNNVNWAWVKITGYTDTTHVTATVMGRNAPTVANVHWRMGLWSDTTGWPCAVAMHEGRLAALTKPLWTLPRVDLTESGSTTSFAPTYEDAVSGTVVSEVRDDNAVSANIAGGELSEPFDLHSLGDLIVFTAGKEFKVTSGSATDQITPTNVQVKAITTHGATSADVIEAADAVVFVQRDGRTLRALRASLDQSVAGYRAKDLTIRNPDIGRSGRADAQGAFAELAWAQSPAYQLHAVRNDGVMPTLTYLPEQEVEAWARQRFAASAAGAAIVESVAAIPYGGVDQLWMIVKRTIGGATQRYVEILEQPMAADDPIEDAFAVDCALTLDNTGTLLGYGTLTPGTGAGTVDATGVTFTASVGGFTSNHVGQRIRYRYVDTANYRGGRHPIHKHLVYATAVALITARNSSTVVECTIESAGFVAGTAIAAADWRLTASTVLGLDHLEGESVYAWADGAPQGPFTVASGAITLSSAAATVHAGLFDGATFEPIVGLDREARARLRKARCNEISLYLYRTLGGKVTVYDPEQPETPYSETILDRTSASPLGQGPAEFSGWTAPIAVPDNWTREPMVMIEQDIPGPMTIRAIAPLIDGSPQ